MAGPRPKLALLNPAALAERCRRSHLLPSSDLSPFVSVAWMRQWSLGEDEAFIQRVLPDPCVQLIVDGGDAHVLGVVTGAYSAPLRGEGFVLGLKFRPGGFHAFTRRPVAEITDRRVPLSDLFPGVEAAELRWATAADGRSVMDALESVLRQAAPSLDSRLQEVALISERIAADSTMLTVEHAARTFSMSPRTLQRLFRTYVGVSPKWMIRRYRIQEAAARVETGAVEDRAELALRLGYFDQAHFINEFTRLVGQPPAEYLNSIEG